MTCFVILAYFFEKSSCLVLVQAQMSCLLLRYDLQISGLVVRLQELEVMVQASRLPFAHVAKYAEFQCESSPLSNIWEFDVSQWA